MRSAKRGLLSTAVATALFGAVGLSSVPAVAHPKGPAPAPAAAQKPPKPLTENQKKDLAKKTYGDAQKKFDAGDFARALVG